MAVTAKEYRAKRRKTITLKSGDKFTLRKFKRDVIMMLLDIFDVKLTPELEAEEMEKAIIDSIKDLDLKEKLPALLDITLPGGIAKPQVELKSDDPEVLTLDEIDPLEQFELFEHIMDFNGFTEEAVKERQSFRDKSTG